MLIWFCPGDRRLSKKFPLNVPSEITPGPGGLLGLELEFSVHSRRSGQVHFGSLIHRLALEGSALDPGDPNAYRCPWGGVITSDGAEAEIAIPPVRTQPGFTGEIQAWAATGEAALCRAMPHGLELGGYSAHFSAAMPARLNDPVCPALRRDVRRRSDVVDGPCRLPWPAGTSPPRAHRTVRRFRRGPGAACGGGLRGRIHASLRRRRPEAGRTSPAPAPA